MEGLRRTVEAFSFFSNGLATYSCRKFYELSFQNQQDASKEYRFKSKGIYRPWENGTFTGTWFDSRGYSFPLKGKFTENELIVYWGNPETEEGKQGTEQHIEARKKAKA